MEIGPIFRALVNQRSRFWLITLEIALTLGIVTNCINMILDQRASMIRPTGIAVEEVMVVRSEPWADSFQDEDYRLASYEEDLRTLRAIPGVVSVTATSAVPLSGSGSSNRRRAEDSELDPQPVPYFFVSEGAIDTLGLELVAGRDFEPGEHLGQDDGRSDDTEPAVTSTIVTQELADLFYPEGDALGRQLHGGGGSVDLIVGIVARMHGSWPQSSIAEHVALYPGRPFGSRRTRYLVRAEPGSFGSVLTSVEPALLQADPGRIVTVRGLDWYKSRSYSGTTAMIQLLTGLSVLLVTVTTLGIIGLTSFSVTQRSREIGTRRALGATRWKILRYFLVENWLMTAVGLAFGTVVAFVLNFGLAQVANVSTIDVRLILAGMLGLWVTGQVAALLPALKGMSVAPVVATRNVY